MREPEAGSDIPDTSVAAAANQSGGPMRLRILFRYPVGTLREAAGAVSLGNRTVRLALSSIWVVLGTVGLLAAAEPPPVESGHSEGAPRPPDPALPVLKHSAPSNLLARSAVVFEPNQGQFDPEVRFASRASGYNLFITEREAVFVLPAEPQDKPNPTGDRSHPPSRLCV